MMHEKKRNTEIIRHILTKMQRERRKYETEVLGKKFIVYPNVFSPKYFDDSGFFADWLRVKENGTFLDMGCGTGLMAIIAILKGASKAVAIDINPDAVINAKENVRKYGMSSKITVLRGNLFEPLKSKGMKFDCIMFNFPFSHVKEREISLIEKIVFDPHYRTITRFLKEVGKYMKRDGRVLIGFSSTIGHTGKLNQLIRKNGYKFKIIRQITRNQKSFPESVIKIELLEVRKND